MAFPGSPLHCVQDAKSLLNYVLGHCICLLGLKGGTQILLCPTAQALSTGGWAKNKER